MSLQCWWYFDCNTFLSDAIVTEEVCMYFLDPVMSLVVRKNYKLLQLVCLWWMLSPSVSLCVHYYERKFYFSCTRTEELETFFRIPKINWSLNTTRTAEPRGQMTIEWVFNLLTVLPRCLVEVPNLSLAFIVKGKNRRSEAEMSCLRQCGKQRKEELLPSCLTWVWTTQSQFIWFYYLNKSIITDYTVFWSRFSSNAFWYMWALPVNIAGAEELFFHQHCVDIGQTSPMCEGTSTWNETWWLLCLISFSSDTKTLHSGL